MDENLKNMIYSVGVPVLISALPKPKYSKTTDLSKKEKKKVIKYLKDSELPDWIDSDYDTYKKKVLSSEPEFYLPVVNEKTPVDSDVTYIRFKKDGTTIKNFDLGRISIR